MSADSVRGKTIDELRALNEPYISPAEFAALPVGTQAWVIANYPLEAGSGNRRNPWYRSATWLPAPEPPARVPAAEDVPTIGARVREIRAERERALRGSAS